jgi:hypothetical protein
MEGIYDKMVGVVQLPVNNALPL